MPFSAVPASCHSGSIRRPWRLLVPTFKTFNNIACYHGQQQAVSHLCPEKGRGEAQCNAVSLHCDTFSTKFLFVQQLLGIIVPQVIIIQYDFEGFILRKLYHHYVAILSRTLFVRVFVSLLFIFVETKLVPQLLKINSSSMWQQ